MKIVTKEDWLPNDNIILEEAADFSVKCDENILVVAGPGAGKTEMLAQKAAYLFQTNVCRYPQKILAISLKKDAAANLKERVCKRCDKEIKSRFSSMTYDAFAKGILDRFRSALPIEWQPAKDYEIYNIETVREVFIKLGYITQYSKKNDLKKIYNAFLSNISFPPKKGKVDEQIWKLLIHGFDGHKASLDFKMIILLVNYILKKNIMLRRALQLTYTYAFLDEFQDTTDSQYEMVLTCFKNSNVKITAVGDNKQRIMKWAGARETVFEDFKNDFNAYKKELLMNHRSAPKLVALQGQMYHSLKEDNLKAIPSKKWNHDDGVVKLLETNSEIDEANILCQDIKSKIDMGIKPNEICILAKQKVNDYSKILIEKLEEEGIEARIENDYQDLLKEPIIDFIIKFIRVSLNRKNPDDWQDIKETSEEVLGIKNTLVESTYHTFYKELKSTLNKVKYKIKLNKEKDINEIINIIIDFLGEINIKKYYTVYSQGSWYSKILQEFENKFNMELQKLNNNWKKAIDGFCGDYSIPIMTIHKSKGLEYKAVYFIGLEDAAFWNFKKEPEEDRCAFFVAISRAKEYLMFTYCSYRETLIKPYQYHKDINEFFELLNNSEVVEVIKK